ncbi:hypothetical protein [Paraburkholderia sp. GAS448]|uniref:hypothetical protein n=1 Tax=Paraburkholderia sp. GAS448 TaxID=3035136 RepID=UPI003D1C404D
MLISYRHFGNRILAKREKEIGQVSKVNRPSEWLLCEFDERQVVAGPSLSVVTESIARYRTAMTKIARDQTKAQASAAAAAGASALPVHQPKATQFVDLKETYSDAGDKELSQRCCPTGCSAGGRQCAARSAVSGRGSGRAESAVGVADRGETGIAAAVRGRHASVAASDPAVQRLGREAPARKSASS